MEETKKSRQETSSSDDIAMETDGSNLTLALPSLTDPSFHDIQSGGSMSPNISQQLQIIMQYLRRGEAYVGQDEKGRPIIQYEQKRYLMDKCQSTLDLIKSHGKHRLGSRLEGLALVKRVIYKMYWDACNANIITEPRTDDDVKMKMESCFEFINYLKTQKPPCGVVLDKTQVRPCRGMYREDHEFEKTKKVLGSGTMAGDIVVIKDKKTGMESAQKTIMISVFRKEEIKAWVDLAETGYAPALYLFRLEGNKVVIEMEVISEAITLRKIVDDYLFRMDASLTKPFSLYVLDGVLRAASTMHDKGWVHRDMHAGNLMLQKQSESKLRVRILDFGMAQSFDGPQGLQFENFRRDISEVVRIFSALYCGQEFDSATDLKRNWQTKLNEIQLAQEDKEELFCLIDSAMKIVHPQDVSEFQGLVKKKLQSALPDAQSHDDMMKRVVALLFPNVRDFRAIHAELEEDSLQESHPVDVADSLMPKPAYSANIKHGDVGDSRVQVFSEMDDPFIPDEILMQFRLSLSIGVA